MPLEVDPAELAVLTDETAELLELELFEPESLRVCPGKITEERDRLLAFKTVERVTLFRAAIPESVSPALTV